MTGWRFISGSNLGVSDKTVVGVGELLAVIYFDSADDSIVDVVDKQSEVTFSVRERNVADMRRELNESHRCFACALLL